MVALFNMFIWFSAILLLITFLFLLKNNAFLFGNVRFYFTHTHTHTHTHTKLARER